MTHRFVESVHGNGFDGAESLGAVRNLRPLPELLHRLKSVCILSEKTWLLVKVSKPRKQTRNELKRYESKIYLF